MESFLTSAGYGALILFGFLEACCVTISSEVTFGFAGVLAYQGHLSLPLVIIIGSLAELAGSCTSFAVGRWGGRPLVDKVGRYVLITRSDVDRAERFLAHPSGADDSRHTRFRVHRRGPHRDAARPVRGTQRDRHRHLCLCVLGHRLCSGQCLEQCRP